VTDGPVRGAHLSLDELADLDEGIGDESGVARSHLDGCAACRERAGTLRASRALLSALPAEPMPAAVAERITAALAAEPPPVRAATVVPLSTSRRWWRNPNVAAAAAGIAVVGLATALIVGRGSSNDTAGTAARAPSLDKNAAGSAVPPLKQWESGADYTKATIPRLVPHLVLGDPPPLSATVGGDAPVPRPTTTSATVLGTSGRPTFDLQSLRTPQSLTACAGVLNDGTAIRPLAVDYALYDGKAAVLLVLPDQRHPETTLDVWVVRSVCSDSAADLVFVTVPRPQ
jgi:hypothetical protein